MTITIKRSKSPQKPRRVKRRPDYSKRMIDDIRALLWVVTVGGRLLHPYRVYRSLALADRYGGPALDGPRDGLRFLPQHGQV